MDSKIVVITGASAGVGRATARAFAKQGAAIGLIARDEARLQSTKKEIESIRGKAVILPVDVSNAKEMHAAAERVEYELGPIDIWVNNAMASVFSPVIEMTAEEYQRVTEVTYLGIVYGTQAALKYMIPRNRGVIVQVGSALAYRAIPLQSAYCGAKHAVQGFTESLRSELMHVKSGIKVTMVQLPGLNTPHFSWAKNRLPRKPCPMPPIFQPEVAAEAIVWAAKHYRREWIVGSSTLLAIEANKIFPGSGDWYLARRGFRAQQYNGFSDPNQPNNLFAPVRGDFGVYGEFKNASSYSLQFWFTRYRLWFYISAILLILLLLF